MPNDKGHALVIGASGGIGLGLVKRLSPTHRITAVARRTERLAELEALGVSTIAADMSDLGAIPEVIRLAVERGGVLSSLTYCAGMQKIMSMRTMSAAEIEMLYTLNLTAPTVLAGQFASRRVSADDGVFCLVSSIAARRPEAGIVAYGASKAGAEALLRGMAREIGPRRAVGVAPGWLDTEMTRAYPHLYGAEFKEQLAKASPAGPATVDAVIDCIQFLLSSQAGSITGEIITVDGGAAL